VNRQSRLERVGVVPAQWWNARNPIYPRQSASTSAWIPAQVVDDSMQEILSGLIFVVEGMGSLERTQERCAASRQRGRAPAAARRIVVNAAQSLAAFLTSSRTGRRHRPSRRMYTCSLGKLCRRNLAKRANRPRNRRGVPAWGG